MKRILTLGLLLVVLVTACSTAVSQPTDSPQRGAIVTVYKSPS